MAKRFAVLTALITLILVALTGCGNHPPTIVGTPTASPNPVEPGNPTTISCTVEDADGDQLSYEWYSVVEDTTYTVASFIWQSATEGNYTFYLTVSDGKGGADYDSSLVINVSFTGISAVTLLPPQDIGTKKVDLIWTSAEPSWTEYKVYRSEEDEDPKNGDVILTRNYGSGNTRLDTTFTDDIDLEPGKDYYYVVLTKDSTNNEAWSNEIMVTMESFTLLGTQQVSGGHPVRLTNTGVYIFCAAREASVQGFTVTNSGPNPGAIIPKPNSNNAAQAYDVGIGPSNLLHVAFGVEGYACFDITNPLMPDDTLQVTSAILGGEARAVYVKGTNIFIGCTDPATSTHTLVWGTVTGNPLTWILLDVDTLHDEPTDIYESDDEVFVAVQNSGLEILSYDAVNAVLNFVYLQTTNDRANRVYVSGDYAYVAASTQGLPIFDVSNSSSPSKPGHWQSQFGNNSQGIYFSGGRAYLADGEYGLRVLDIQDPLDPDLLGTKDLSEVMPGGYRLTDVWVRSQGTKTQAILADWFGAIHMIEW